MARRRKTSLSSRKNRLQNAAPYGINIGKIQPIYSFARKKVKAEADKRGIPMDEREFHCRGEFKGVHKGRPNDEDLKAAAAFAKAVAAKG